MDIERISVKTWMFIVEVTEGLDPEAGHVQVSTLLPASFKYIEYDTRPVDVVEELVPKIVSAVSIVIVAVHGSVNALPSSPKIFAVIVNAKFAEGVEVEVVRAMVYA